MEPQARKKNKPQQQVADSKTVRTRIPVTVKGQRYESPEGRHSQKTHARAEQRATDAGHASEKEQHAHDKTAVTTQIAAKATALKLNQEQSKQK